MNNFTALVSWCKYCNIYLISREEKFNERWHLISLPSSKSLLSTGSDRCEPATPSATVCFNSGPFSIDPCFTDNADILEHKLLFVSDERVDWFVMILQEVLICIGALSLLCSDLTDDGILVLEYSNSDVSHVLPQWTRRTGLHLQGKQLHEHEILCKFTVCFFSRKRIRKVIQRSLLIQVRFFVDNWIASKDVFLAKFSPDDQYSRQRLKLKTRFRLLLTQTPLAKC